MAEEKKTKKQTECALCGKKLSIWNTSGKKHNGEKTCNSCGWKLARQEIKDTNEAAKIKKISETKVTCSSCGNIWHYNKNDELENLGNALQGAGTASMCCTGCFPALFIPNKPVKDLNKCPNCGSRAIKKEKVIHEVK